METSDLSDAEAAGILFMREEEKLARDVYAALYELWNYPVFANISRSEQQHMDSLGVLLERYQLEDPIEDLDIADLRARIGETDNEDVAFVYENLVNGSGNHLRSFVAQLERLGDAYEVSYITEDEAAAILSTGAGRGPAAGRLNVY